MTGLLSQFIEAPLLLQKRMVIPKSVGDMCQFKKQLFKGNAAGFNDTQNFTGYKIVYNLSLEPSPHYLVS
jgi:hypothetical protein